MFWGISTQRLLSGLRSIEWLYVMIGMIGFNKERLVIFRWLAPCLEWRFGHASVEAAWVSYRPRQCRISPKKNKICQTSMKKIRQVVCDLRTSSRTYAVGLPTASNDSMLWTLWLVSTNNFWCRSWAFVLLIYALETFFHAIEILLFYPNLSHPNDMILSS